MSLPSHREVLLLVFLLAISFGASSAGVEIKRSKVLSENRYVVSWTADLQRSTIEFEVTAKTTGFVGFGLSPSGSMNHADVVTGGVKNGQVYFHDRHVGGDFRPVIDKSQDWFLISGSENGTHTTLRFNRSLDTCDTEDLPINNDTTTFIWSMGATDEVRYHGANNRGQASVNILDPTVSVTDMSKFDVWHLNVNNSMPNVSTTYWCTAHKTPNFPSKRHIVGFRVKLDNEGSLKHNHHLILHRCGGSSPQDLDLYESFVGTPGGRCYLRNKSGISQLMKTCETYVYVWAKGGDPFFLPNDIGMPLNEDGTQEYFVVEIHYDNPEELSGVQYDTGLEVYYTDELRPKEAGILKIGHSINWRLMIPPETPEFTVVGHCSSACTKSQLPKEGIQVFNILLHSHLAGRKLKLRQFRKWEELPWIAYDDHYDFNFQQNRLLPEYATVLPGDQLTMECVDDSTNRAPSSLKAILGGLSTTEEMCDAYVMYYPRLPNLEVCSSEFNETERLFQKMGFQKVELDPIHPFAEPMVLEPPEFRNSTYHQIISDLVPWNSKLRRDVQGLTRYGNHRSVCASNHWKQEEQKTVKYPSVIPYKPKSVCKRQSSRYPTNWS